MKQATPEQVVDFLTGKRSIRPQLTDILQEKLKLDGENRTLTNMVSYNRWIVDALELLLQIELMKQLGDR